MIDTQTRYRIITGLRKAYFMSSERKKVLERCETATPAMKKDGTPKLRAGKQCYTRRYTCEVCKTSDHKVGTPKKPGFQIDHIAACGGTPGTRDTPKWWSWGIYINRLFVSSTGMQGICHRCHSNKTIQDKADMRSGDFYQKVAKEIQAEADKTF